MHSHTPVPVVGGRHCPLSPFGPKIECLDRVSCFGGGRVRDLQNVSKNGRGPLVKQYLSEKCETVCEMPQKTKAD